MARTLVVFGTNLLIRGYLSSSTDRTSDDGRPTNALYAATRALRTALSFKEPEHAVAVFDQDLDWGQQPPLLREQAKAFPDLLAAHGIEHVTVSDAVHVVASYVQAALDAGDDVVIVASDKRLAQLVSDRVWWYDAYKDVRYTPELVRKRFEVTPEYVAGWLALVGDDDALPGVKGIGKKGATTLVTDFGSVEAAIERADDVDGRTGKALRASLDAAIRELARATLDRTRELPQSLRELPFTAPDVADLNALYGELGFYSLLETDETAAEIDVRICTTEEAVSEALAALPSKPVALQAVIGDPSPPRGELAGLAVALSSSAALYFPFAGKGTCLEGPQSLARWLEDADAPKIGHDTKAACVALARLGVKVAGVVGDSVCASHLASPSGMAPHDLPVVVPRILRRALDDDDAVRGVGRRRKAWSQLNVEVTAEHAACWACAAHDLWAAFEADLLADDKQRELHEEYLELGDTLLRMELAGIACDSDDLAQAGEDFDATQKQLEKEVHEHAGKEFNLGSTKQLGSVLFEDLGLTIYKRTKTGWSTATDALERIEHEHPIVPLVIRWRLLRHLRDNWVTALQGHISDDGRVHSHFHHARSFSGRIINSVPDLGRVPGRTEDMARIRHAFHAPPGTKLLSVDYKQLGLYVLAHLTRDPNLVEPLREQDDMHVLTAAAVLEKDRSEIGERERQIGKVVNFATFAGQGPGALRLQLGVTPAEAKDIIARFDRRYTVARAFQDEQLRLAKERGYLETIAGRRWPIGGLESLDSQMLGYAERLARRGTHEGSVGDVTRRGLLLADRALREAGLKAFPLLQILDEVLFEVPEDELSEAARLTSEAMKNAYPLHVPLRVTCKVGPNWADLELYPIDS